MEDVFHDILLDVMIARINTSKYITRSIHLISGEVKISKNIVFGYVYKLLKTLMH